MQKEIIIGTLNCQNTEQNRQSIKQKGGVDAAKVVASHIKKMKYDILGTQELTRPLVEKIDELLDNYQSVGKYRYGNNFILRHIKSIQNYNESNRIFAKQKVIISETQYLPWLPRVGQFCSSFIKGFIVPRIMTYLVIELPIIGEVLVINTHLNHHFNVVKAKQLRALENRIKKYADKYPIILMGDFNMRPTDKIFGEFIDKMDALGIRRVEVNDITHDESGKVIDHIFLSNSFEVTSCGLIRDLDPSISLITDHNGVYAKVKVRV